MTAWWTCPPSPQSWHPEPVPPVRIDLDGIEKLRNEVDTLIIVPNEKLLNIVERREPISEAFRKADDILRQAIFSSQGSQMVVVRDIEFYSMCEHHILPFFGTVSIGYIPRGSMVGLSKLPRLVNAIARRLQVQERLTAEICTHVAATLDTDGVIVACNARHLCMQMRGVEKQMASTDTIDYCGRFASDASLRQEFFSLINR